MNSYNKPSYVQVWLQRQFNASLGTDVVLDESGNILAWNAALGVQPTPQTIDAGVVSLYKADLVSSLNTLAGQIRQSHLADGMHIAEEYRLAEDDARLYIASNYTLTPVPQTLADYAAVTGYPASAIANLIIQKGNESRTLLTLVRKIRIVQGTTISASSSIEAADLAFQSGVASLEALRKK